MKSKSKTSFVCNDCGSVQSKWSGQCPDCHAWNTLVEFKTPKATGGAGAARQSWTGLKNEVVELKNVEINAQTRTSTTLDELDRVLGGGIVEGAVILMGGDPGIGKSTILLQTLVGLCQQWPVLYITGEESLQQVALRSQRLGLAADSLKLMAETHIESILAVIRQEKPKAIVIDSIQTIYTDQVSSAPGSVSQVRESTAALVQLAKQTGTAIFIVGHVTKDGALAGPRVLEHMVDCVLYFEGETDGRLRLIRAIKNRFGAVNELGVFAMTDQGLKPVNNPSAMFLSRYSNQAIPGSMVSATKDGSRPLLIEVQALVDESQFGQPRRVCVGIDPNRVGMLMAILSRHGGVLTGGQDVFVNVVGGIKILETATDLAVVLAIVSSLRNAALSEKTISFGELGLSGEVRPVANGVDRLREAAKHGFTTAIVPKGNCPRNMDDFESMTIIGVQSLQEALTAAFQ